MALLEADASPMPRELCDGLFWVFKCDVEMVAGRGPTHGYNALYLLKGSRRTVLIDAGQPKHWAALSPQIERALGGRDLDYVFPTHCEAVHAGNLPFLLQRYPRARAVGDLRGYHLYFPGWEDRCDQMGPGDVLDLGDRRLTFLKPVLYDLPDSLWAYEEPHQVLFVADGLAHEHHRPSDCGHVTAELSSLPTLDNFTRYNDRAFYWTRFSQMRPFFEELEDLLRRHPTRLIAPAHGTVITTRAQEIISLAEAGMSVGELA